MMATCGAIAGGFAAAAAEVPDKFEKLVVHSDEDEELEG